MSSFGGVWEARYEEVSRRAEKCFRRGGLVEELVVVVADVVVAPARGLSITAPGGAAAAASSSSKVHAPPSSWSPSTRVCSASV
jgi:hypothetical protein